MTLLVSDLDRLPQELKQRNQWCIAGSDKSPYAKLENSLRRVSVHEKQLHSFEEACELAAAYNTNIGFVISEDDPFCCVDLDVKDLESADKEGKPLDPALLTTQRELDGFATTLRQFATYAELSKSGKGLHLWLKGAIGKGVKRDCVEIYSQERFVICTGNALSDLIYHIDNGIVRAQILNANPFVINQNDTLLNQAVEAMRVQQHSAVALEEIEEEFSNREIHERALGADNGEKYRLLCEGDWQKMGYASQSEADLALMSIYTFYSKSNSQCRQLFRCTGLGKREKAVRDDVYLNRTLTLIRSRQAKQEELAAFGKDQAEKLFANLQPPVTPTTPPGPPDLSNIVAKMQQPTQQNLEAITHAVAGAQLPQVEGGLDWPPGLAGAIAGFIYQNSQHPVREVAIVGALGLLAGICGKAFILPGTGLNLYIVLVAGSGIGKEAMHHGVQTLVRSVSELAPTITQFVDFTKPVSGPALTKMVAGNPSFVNVIGEFGRRMRQMAADDGREGPMQQLRTVMTDLYGKSSPGSVVGGLRYSNKDNDVRSISGVAYSMIGETTPETYYESLSGSMMEDGFLSRFSTIEYTGDRPHHSENIIEKPDENLRQALAGLATQATTLIGRFQTQEISFTKDAAHISNEFRRYCTEMINKHKGHNEIIQMWNRAHIKVIRMAGLLATADNYINPEVNLTHLQWALNVVNRDIVMSTGHFEKGEVGDSDWARVTAMLNILRNYLEVPPPKSYRHNEDLRKQGLIQYRVLSQKASKLSCFYKHRNGAAMMAKLTIRELQEQGYLVEIPKYTAKSEYNCPQLLYRILEV